jgi:hypothetical protein
MVGNVAKFDVFLSFRQVAGSPRMAAFLDTKLDFCLQGGSPLQPRSADQAIFWRKPPARTPGVRKVVSASKQHQRFGLLMVGQGRKPMGRLVRTLLLLASVLIIPTAVQAQATLAGVVRDTSGAVLPGVTVEAASPVLIEKVRTSVTDSVGRYQIIDLRPGTYTVTFTLTGFATVRREAVELSGTAVTTVNGDMRVGGVQETITVSGETPTVDLQTATRQTVMDQEVVTAVPTSRNSFAVGVLIPGVTVSNGFGSQQDVGGALGPTTLALMAHGSRVSDQRLMVNGVSLSTMIGGGWGGGAVPNATGTAEFAIDTSGVDASLATGGVRTNFIPRDGGNRFSGTVFGSYATEGFASDNFDADLLARGLSTPGNIKVNGDFNPGFGGPIKRDKVWFFLSGLYQIADLFWRGMFHIMNA